MRFRLYPTKLEEQTFKDYCAQTRYVYNIGLEQRNLYKAHWGPTPNLIEQCRQLTEARHDGWLSLGVATIQQQALRDLDKAFQNWWRNPIIYGRPTWRKKGENESFKVLCPSTRPRKIKRVSRRTGQVNVPKLGWVKFKWSKDPGSNIRSYSIKLDTAGRWWINFTTIPDPIDPPLNDKSIGIDCGVNNSYVTSEEEFISVPKLTESELKQKVRLERKIARQQFGSKNRNKTKIKLARLNHRKINRKKDVIEKLTTQLASNYDFIYIEDLKIQKMTKSAKGTIENPGSGGQAKKELNRKILESGWGLFAQRLQDKAPDRVVKISPAFTSQKCSECGYTDEKNRKNQADFQCINCGHEEHADVNAAKNIAAGHVVNDCEVGELSPKCSSKQTVGG